MASVLRQDIGAEIPAGIEGILGNKVMGDLPWKAEETDVRRQGKETCHVAKPRSE